MLFGRGDQHVITFLYDFEITVLREVEAIPQINHCSNHKRIPNRRLAFLWMGFQMARIFQGT